MGRKAARRDDDISTNNLQWILDNLPRVLDIVDQKEETRQYWLQVLKTLFDGQSKKRRRAAWLGPIDKLHIQGFQVEQLWEQLQLRNHPLLRFVNKRLQQLETHSEESVELDQPQQQQNEQEEESKQEDTEQLEEDDEIEDTTQIFQPENSVEQDRFFSYEALAEAADKPLEEDGVDEEDDEDLWQEELYEAQGEAEEEEEAYENFFDQAQPPENKKKQIDPLEEKIKELEQKQIGTKHWSMLGEVRASERPLNSALDIELDFDSAMRQRQVSNEKSKQEENDVVALEDKMKQRIAELAFDDVVRVQPVETSTKVETQLSQEKDRRGLSELYEEQYLEKMTGQNKKQDKKYEEIDLLFKQLTKKLDALSNFHYTPRPAPPELKVIASNLPSIVAEEAVPEVLGSGDLLAPEQIYKPSSSNAKTTTSSEERKKWRRKRKRAGKKLKLRKQYEAKVVAQENGATAKQKRQDALKTLETWKQQAGKQIKIHKSRRKGDEPIENKINKTHSASLKL